MKDKILYNNQIKAKNVRVIDENGQQLGIFSLQEAINIAKEKGLDLVQVTDKVNPPVCKITDYGKYLYIQKKKKKASKKSGGELKNVRVGFNISQHDIEIKVNQIKKFFEKNHKVKIEMILKGREMTLKNEAIEKIKKILSLLEEKVEYKVERDIKLEPRGFTVIISKK